MVVPMAGGSLITKIHKSFKELYMLGFIESADVKYTERRPLGAPR